MKSRAEAAQYVREQFERLDGRDVQATTRTGRSKGRDFGNGFGSYKFHYGKQDLRDLLDFIFDGAPTTAEEMVE